MKYVIFGAFTVVALALSSAQAANYPAGTVNFSGSLLEGTCSVSVSGTDISLPGSSTTVTFPVTAASAFGGLNQGPVQSFMLDIGNCPGPVTALNLIFAGAVDADNSNAFANSTGSGTATGVAVLLTDKYGSIFVPNQASSPYNIAGNTGITVNAQLLQTRVTEPTDGSVTVNATLQMLY